VTPVASDTEERVDARLDAAAQALFEIVGSKSGAAGPTEGHRLRARQILAAIDAADQAAGNRRISNQGISNREANAWDDGYQACYEGQQRFRNPHRHQAG
jgi:hypothetical protein